MTCDRCGKHHDRESDAWFCCLPKPSHDDIAALGLLRRAEDHLTFTEGDER